MKKWLFDQHLALSGKRDNMAIVIMKDEQELVRDLSNGGICNDF